MNFPVFIAKRYLISRKSHNAINIISGISVAGICIGTMALVIVLSTFNGLSDLVRSLYNSFHPDLLVVPVKGKVFDPSAAPFAKVRKLPGVASYTEVLQGNALLKYRDQQSIATIKGVSQGYAQASGFDSLIIEGGFDISQNNAIFGKGLSNKLGASVNDMFQPVSAYAPKRGASSSLNPEDGLNELKIYPAGSFSINDDFDYEYTIVSIENARRLLDYENEASSIELQLLDGYDAGDVKAAVQSTLGDAFRVEDREEQNALLYKTLRSEKLWTFIILVFILVIATFNVIGSLTMLIIEKKKDITILHHMGADIRMIRRIFLAEGMFITFIGGLAGLLLGIFVCWLQMRFGLVKLTEGYVVEAYPVAFRLYDLLAIIAVVMLIGFFAAWYPVRVFTSKHLARS